MRGPVGTLSPSRLQPDAADARRGFITFICGCMFSGKTTELIRRISRYSTSKTVAIKHEIDTRYSETDIVSHAGKAYPARVVAEARQISAHLRDDTEIVALDEAHFFDENLVEVTLQLATRGIDVVLASLHPDSWGKPFPVGERLRAIADEPITLFATCARCGETADCTQRLTPISGSNMVGGAESAEPRCVKCWTPPATCAPRLTRSAVAE